MDIVNSIARSVEDFILFMKPLELNAMDQGYALNIISAQVAQETGWGRYVIGKNLFNIKATDNWHGSTAEVWTTEYIHGKPIQVKAVFRDYPSYDDSLNDYIALIKMPRYTEAWENRLNAEKYFKGLVKGGYATDPIYARNLIRRYDKICELMLKSLKIITEYHKS
jgi:flagellar protein FlgJ